jgi:DNA-binding PadR family transcriptional regulator
MFAGQCGDWFFGGQGDRRGRSWGGGFDDFVGAFWWGGPGGRGRRRGPGRMFEQGDLKYVILRLLDEKPRHGYEIIKELEDRFSGAYSPSPGTVYPTLTMLEDLGYAQASVEEGGRKIYSITDAGRAYLAENSETVDGIFERVSRFVEGFLDEPMMEVNGAFRRLGRATYTTASRHVRDVERLRKVREILDQAVREIDQIDRPAEPRPGNL